MVKLAVYGQYEQCVQCEYEWVRVQQPRVLRQPCGAPDL